MSFSNNDFEKQWEVLFRDVKKLNEYTAIHSIELQNVKVENRDMEGAIFKGAFFTGVEWTEVDMSRATLTKVVFEKCKFVGGKWGQGILTGVEFNDCEFVDTSLSKSTMTNVKFTNCKLIRTGVGYLTGGKVEFNGCTWDMGAAGDSTCEFIFRKSSLSGISFSMMKGMVPILFEDCLLDEVDFYQSHFSDVVLRLVKQGEGPIRFNSMVAESVTFDDVDITRGVSLAHIQAKLVRVVGGRFGAAFEGAKIDKVVARDAFLANIDFSEAHMPLVEIGKCELFDLALWEGVIKDLSITNSEIDILDATDFRADTMVWDNVTLDGKIDLTNAQVKDFRPTRLKRGPQLQLVTTGSNLRFN